MNVVGNRHVGNNVRIMLINNGKGNEFRNYNHPCYFLGEEADRYVAAAGHYGNKSHKLVKDYATDLGYEYLCASNKEEFLAAVDKFLSSETNENPILFEVFTETEDESNALEILCNVVSNPKYIAKKAIKGAVKQVLGDKGVKVIKSALGK